MRHVHLTPRDVELLRALWKWKMLTSAAIWKGFFPNKNANTSYQRLWHLEDGGFIERRAINQKGNGFVWILTPKGFEIVREDLHGLKEEGYLSESIEHDRIVTAVHAGDWLTVIPSHVELFTEQELRRLDPDTYPLWVPYSELHRPDGYWRIRLLGEMAAIALEVELTQKSAIRYRLIANFYQEKDQVLRVVWVVLNQDLGEKIRRHVKDGNPESLDLHNFVLLQDFKKLGWSALFTHGLEKDRPLKDLLNGGLRHTPAICRTHDLLDFRKAPGKSRTSKVAASA